MSFLKFYIILIVLGILIDVLGLILSNQATTGQLAFCLVTSVLFLIIGIRGLVNKFMDYS